MRMIRENNLFGFFDSFTALIGYTACCKRDFVRDVINNLLTSLWMWLTGEFCVSPHSLLLLVLLWALLFNHAWHWGWVMYKSSCQNKENEDKSIQHRTFSHNTMRPNEIGMESSSITLVNIIFLRFERQRERTKVL